MRDRNLHLTLEQFRLDNGLRVFLNPDPAAPVVSVCLWYHAGSKDDAPEKSGVAHLLEHLMFEGSAGHDGDYFLPLQEAGGAVNASTSADRTNYYEVVPPQYLELALWLEADRMGRLLPVLTDEKFRTQHAVVINERRQRVDNQPYGRIYETLLERLYPPGHPYSWPVIGRAADLDGLTLDDVRQFHRRHYDAANATLTIAGAFCPTEARGWVERYFAPLGGPAQPRHRLPVLSSPLPHHQFIEWEEPVALPRADLVWPTVPAHDADEPALDYLSQILGSRSKDARLPRALVHDRNLAQTIGCSHGTGLLAGQFSVRWYALPGASLDEITQGVDSEIRRIEHEPPTEMEMCRTRCDLLNLAYSQVETTLGRAEVISQHVLQHGWADGGLIERELDRYQAVRPEDVCRVAERYLSRPRVSVRVAPASQGVRLPAIHYSEDRGERTRRAPPCGGEALPKPGKPRAFQPPKASEWHLDNGLRVWLVSLPDQPRVHCKLVCRGGSACDPADRYGLARLTTDCMDEGTHSRDGVEIARALDQWGTALSVSAGMECTFLTMRSLREHLHESLSLFADILLNPAWRAPDVDRERKRLLADLDYHERQPASLADDAIDAALFTSQHPYGRPTDGTREGIQSILREDLGGFHARQFVPDGATLVVCGAVEPARLRDLIQEHLGEWSSGPTSPLHGIYSDVSLPTGPQLVWIDRPGAAQSVLRLGKRTERRRSDRYYALVVLNTILGGQFSSRLNQNLRESKGYTYGARSSLMLRRELGSLIAGADVGADWTVPSLEEFLREFRDLAGERSVTAEELAFAKSYLVRRYPARFETAGAVASQLAYQAVHDLPEDDYEAFPAGIEGVSLDEVRSVAAEACSLEDAQVVIVGDPSRARAAKELLAEAIPGA